MSKEKNDIASDEDFSDASAEGEFMDGDLDDDAWDDAEFSDDDMTASKPKGKKSKAAKSGKKKSKLLPILAVAGVAILAALYLVGSKGQAPAPQGQPAPAQQQVAQDNAAQDNNVYAELQKMQQPSSEETPVLPPDPPQAATKGAGFLNNPEQLSEVEQLRETMQFEETTVAAEQGEQPPMPAPVQAGEAAMPRSPLTPMPSAEAPPPMDITADMPVIKSTGVKENHGAESALLPKAQDIAIGETPAPVAAPADNAAGEKLAAELSQMNEMLESLSDRMSDLENKVDNAKNSSSDLKEIKTALAKLENRVDAMGGESPAPRDVARPSSPRAVAPAPSAAKPAAVSAAKGWILKAAQPGRAIVTRMGSDETYSVSVGDKLDGIGKISSIAQQDGKWIVVGATGKIVQ